MENPSSVLTPPEAVKIIPEPLDTVLHLDQFISLGHWAFVAIDKMGGGNLPELLGTAVAGDWTVVAKASDALTKLGVFSERAAAGIRSDWDAVDLAWDGGAAAAARTYFATVASEVAALQSSLDTIAGDLRQTAYGVYSTGVAIGNALEALVDYAIAAGIEYAIAAATSETVVGGIIFGIAGTYSVVRGALLVKQIIEYHGLMMIGVDALTGILAGTLGTLRDFEAVRLPGGYVNEGIPKP